MGKPITLCDRCDIVMSCLLDYDGVPCRRNRTVQPTNADRIRAMMDEELAEWECDRSCMLCPIDGCDGRMEVGRKMCKQRWLDWLKQEVDE